MPSVFRGWTPTFTPGQRERERSNSDFSQHLSLSLYLPFSHPLFTFIHLKLWQRTGYFNWRNNSLFRMNMNTEHEMWQNGTMADIICSSLFTVCSEPRRMRDVQYRKCTHAIFVVNINASLYTVIKKLQRCKLELKPWVKQQNNYIINYYCCYFNNGIIISLRNIPNIS